MHTGKYTLKGNLFGGIVINFAAMQKIKVMHRISNIQIVGTIVHTILAYGSTPARMTEHHLESVGLCFIQMHIQALSN